MAEATFQPGAPVGFESDSAMRGMDHGQSMMMRAQQMRENEQMMQLRQQEIAQHRMLLPVKIAQAGADVASAAASIATNTRMQEYRKQAAEASPGANNEFLDALKLADWDAQSSELSRIQAKYAFMGQLPEYKGFLDTVDKARANAVTRALTDQKLDQAQEMARMAVAGRVAVAETNAGARKEVADTNAGARVDAATISAGARRDVAESAHGSSAARAEYRGNMQSALEADKEAIKLEEGGNEEAADQARKRAFSFRQMAKKSLAAPAAAPAASQPSAVAPAASARLYHVEHEGEPPSFTSAVKTPDDVLRATQQMVNDGIITAEQGRETLLKLGFKKKGS